MLLADQVRMVRDCVESKLGVVVALDRDKGTLTLAYGDGTCSDLQANASLLENLRMGGPVQVLAEGATVLTLRRL